MWKGFFQTFFLKIRNRKWCSDNSAQKKKKKKKMVARSKKIQLLFLARNKNIETEKPFSGKAIKPSNKVALLDVA